MNREIRPLTGLRGLAASWVVIYHIYYNQFYDLKNNGGWLTFLEHGYLAVDVFFILSGFVMALSYERFVVKGWTGKSYAAFLMRRIARIYPLYLLVICAITLSIILGLSHSLPLSGLGKIFAANVFLIQDWGIAPSIDGPTWSISTEFAVYILFPLLSVCTLVPRKILIPTAVATGCILTLCYMQNIATHNADDRGLLDFSHGEHSAWPVIRCVTEFTLGLYTFRIFKNQKIRAWFRPAMPSYFLAAVILVVVAIPYSDILFVVLIPAFILALALGDNGIARFMGSKMVFFLGEISYSLYLLHNEFLRIHRLGSAKLETYMNPLDADLASAAALIVSLLLCAYLTYNYIEKPSRNTIRRLEEQWLEGKRLKK